MAASRKASVLNNYDAFRAAQRSGGRPEGHEHVDSAPPRRRAETPARKSGSTRFGRTVLPSVREVICYECGYRFTVSGRPSRTHCPKCRAALQRLNIAIDSEWTEDVKTIGTIHVKPGAVLKQGRLVADEVVLEGQIDGGTVEACGRLTLCPGARIDPRALQAHDVLVAGGARLQFRPGFTCHNMDVQGDIRAKLHVQGTVTVRRGGTLRGEVHGEHLVVEEGAGLKARLFIQPPARRQPGRSKRR